MELPMQLTSWNAITTGKQYVALFRKIIIAWTIWTRLTDIITKYKSMWQFKDYMHYDISTGNTDIG